MDLNCFKIYPSNEYFTSDTPVDTNGFLNLNHSFHDSNTSFLDGVGHQSNNPSYLSSNDVNTSNIVDDFCQHAAMPMSDNQRHFYPQILANSSLHCIEPPHELNIACGQSNQDSMFIPMNVTDGKSAVVKGHWTPEEDCLLTELVEKHGTKKWSYIAQKLGARVGKQCRERWHNHLKPDIKKGSWSMEEEKILIEAHCEIGNKWVEISKRLPGRSENSIKNHWNATKRKIMHLTGGNKKNRRKHPTLNGSLLQNYINTLSLDSSTTTAAALVTKDNKKEDSCSGIEVSCPNQQTLYHYDQSMYNFYARMPSETMSSSLYESNHIDREMDLMQIFASNNNVVQSSF